MAKFPKIQTTPNRVRIVIMMLILGLALLILFFNAGFRNAFYHATWNVKLPEAATEEYMNSFSSSPYLASLDKQNKELHWQGIPETELNRVVDEIRTQFPEETISVTEMSELLPTALVVRTVYIVLFGLIVSLVYLYFMEIGKFNSRKVFFQVTGLNVVALIWGGVVMLGILSSMSLIYKLTEYSLLTLVVMVLWVGMGYYRSLLEIRKEPILDLALESQRRFWRQLNKSTWNWLVLFVVLLAIGLNTVFVVDAILLAVALILGSYVQQELPILLHRLVIRIRGIRFYKSSGAFKRPTVVKPTASITKVNVSKPKKVKVKAKKTKKSRRKS